MREIEVKIRTNDLKSVEARLKELGCLLSAPIRQQDALYSYGEGMGEWEGPKEGHLVVRIRRMADRAEFNMKQQRSNELDNIEHETKIDNPDAMHAILLALGYKPKVEVKKMRRKGKLGEYEICLDEVEGLGGFVELEKLAPDDADPTAIQEELLRTAESLGLSRVNQESRGYDTKIFHLSRKQDV